jgi:hypothetical protein
MAKGTFTAVALGLVAGLLLGEVGTRVAAPQVFRRPPVWEFDARLGWRHRPGAAGRLVTPEFDVPVVINADGLRDRAAPPQRGTAGRRLLAFGDSFVEGWGVPLDASVSKQVEQRLAGSGATGPVEVLNCGVAGYGTDQELLLYESLAPRFAADTVLLFFYGNDLWNNASDRGIGAERGYKPYFRLDSDGRLVLRGTPVRRLPQWDEGWWDAQPWPRRWDRFLGERVHIYALARRALAHEEVDEAQRGEYYAGLFGPADNPQPARLWALTQAIVGAFADRVEANGARLVIVYVPSIVQIEPADWRAKRELAHLGDPFDLDRPNRELARVATARRLRWIDLTPAFRARAADQVLYYRDSHWNAAGHALAGEVLAEALGNVTEKSGTQP